jgi:cation:H+ antiporter
MVVGLTIVSFGTSLPELTVNLMASFGGNAEIAIGNVLGSNIANVLLILGASALVANLTVKRPHCTY